MIGNGKFWFVFLKANLSSVLKKEGERTGGEGDRRRGRKGEGGEGENERLRE